MAGAPLPQHEEDRRMREYLKGGSSREIAERLDISPQTFLYWKRKHSLHMPRGRVSDNITEKGEAATPYSYPTTEEERKLVGEFLYDLVTLWDACPGRELQEKGVTKFMDEWVNQREKGGASRWGTTTKSAQNVVKIW